MSPRSAPSECGCPEKTRLIEELADCHKRILILHNNDVVAILNGDCDPNPHREAYLLKERELREFMIRTLRDHVASHEC